MHFLHEEDFILHINFVFVEFLGLIAKQKSHNLDNPSVSGEGQICGHDQ